MKIFVAALALILGIALAQAGGMFLLNVGSADGNGGGPPPVDCGVGAIDASAGCPLPMLGM